MAQSYDRRINLYINGTQVKNDISSIRKEMYKLTNEQAHMTIGSREYYEQAAKIKQLKGIMAQHVQDISNVKKGWSLQRMADGFNRYFAMITAAMASFAGVALTIKSSVQAFAEFDDKLSDVQKTTGLTKDQVKALSNELAKIDTRSSQQELLDLARVAGKLGITAEEEVLGFVRAADKIKVALSEDLGGDVEESINQIGKLADVFRTTEQFGIEEALLKIGSAINSLGAAGTANEAYIVEFSKRMAGIAPSAGISIQQVLGLAATLDELAVSSEVSGTVVNNVIAAMFKDTATYAGIAGMKLEDFTTLMKTDANEAFIQLLNGAKGSGSGFAEMAVNLDKLGLDGARSTGVLTVLANNIDKLREKQAYSNQEFEKGTSIVNEFNTKNQNAQAELEKAKKAFTAMQVELGERLTPAYTSVIHKSSALLKILGATVEFLFKYGSQIVVVVASIAAYSVAVKAAAFWEGALNKEKGIGLLLTKTGIVLNRAASAAMLLYQAAVAALAGNFAKATRAMQLFWAFASLNPIGLLVGAVTALAGAMYLYSKRLTDAVKIQRMLTAVNVEAEKQIADQKVMVEQLLKVAQNEYRSKEDRIAAIKKLNEISPEYLKGLSLETINTDAAKTATDKYIDSLRQKAKIQAANEKLVEIEKQLIDLTTGEGESAAVTFWQQTGNAIKSMGNMASFTYYNAVSSSKNLVDKQKELNLQKEKLLDITTKQINLDKTAGAVGADGSSSAGSIVPELSEKDKKEAEKMWDFILADGEKQQDAIRAYFSKAGEGAFEAFMSAIENESAKIDFSIQPELPDEKEKKQPAIDAALEAYMQTNDYKLQLNQAMYDKGLILEQQYQDNLTKITREEEEKRFQIKQEKMQAVQDIAYMATDFVMALMDLELEKAGDDEKKKKEIKKKYADLNFAVTVAQIIASTAGAIMQGYAQLGPIAGTVAAIMLGATGLVQLGVANSQRKQVKAYATGGFTDGDRVYRAGEAGTEWIAPNWMVNKYRNTFAGLENLRVNPSAASTAAGFNSPPASGGVPAGGGGFGSVSNEVLAALANELAEFRKWKPKVYTELIKKDLDTLNEIDNKR